MGIGPVDDVGQQSGHGHPKELVPVEEGKIEEDGLAEVVEGNPQQTDIGDQKQPKPMRATISRHDVSSMQIK
jgi:hypothetical protein